MILTGLILITLYWGDVGSYGPFNISISAGILPDNLMKIIFLDIDGVLNCEDAYRDGECKYQDWTWEDGRKDHYQRFCIRSKDLLNRLIDETGAKIVISSTWRMSGIDFMRKVWEYEEMHGEIIGITPSLRAKGISIPRGMEIKYYLENDLGFRHINWSEEEQQKMMDESDVENYIIIDDDSDMLYGQRNHFVHVLPSPINKEGFNERYFYEAATKLNRTVIDLNYNQINIKF